PQGQTELRVREPDRAAASMVPEGAVAGHGTEVKRKLESGRVMRLEPHREVLALRLGSGRTLQRPRLQKPHPVDLADAGGIDSSQRATVSDAVAGGDLRRPKRVFVERNRRDRRVVERLIGERARIGGP